MKFFITLFALLGISSIGYTQVTQQGIQKLLEAQGIEHPDENAEMLYKRYCDNRKTSFIEINKTVAESAMSGFCMGFFQARNFKYTKVRWMPGFMQAWYSTSMNTENVFGKSFTWQKMFRESDYFFDRLAYEDFNRIFENKWYLAAITHMLIKNFAGIMIKNKMRTDSIF